MLRIYLVDNIYVMIYQRGPNVHINIYMIYKRRSIDEIINYENRCLWGERRIQSTNNENTMVDVWVRIDRGCIQDWVFIFKVFNKSTKPKSKKNKLSSKSVHNQYVLMNIVKQNIWKKYFNFIIGFSFKKEFCKTKFKHLYKSRQSFIMPF